VAFDPARQPPDDLADAVGRITGGAGVKYAIDPVAGATGSAVVECLGPRGRMLCYGTLSPDPLAFSPRALMTRSAAVEGFWLSRHMATLGLLSKLGVVKAITKLMRAGVLVSEVGETFPLERVVEAARTAEKAARGGKVLLRIGE
jgi:NADPH:quinone reductase